MDITKIIETLPTELKNKVVDFHEGQMRKDGKIVPCFRILFERDTPSDLYMNLKSKRYLGSGMAINRNAPEITYPYIYIKG